MKALKFSTRKLFFLPLSALLFNSCAPYRYATTDYEKQPVFEQTFGESPNTNLSTETLRKEAYTHPLYKFIPIHRSQIYWFDAPRWILWALFGNDLSGIFGESPKGYYATNDKIGTKRALKFFTRNPLHNFTFYIIGTAHHPPKKELALLSYDSEKVHILKTSSPSRTVFAGPKTSFFIGFHGFLPYISLRLCHKGQTDFYFGWREKGNFGIKFIPFKKTKKGNPG